MLRQPNGPASPLTFGSRFSSGTTASSSTISPVIEARSESLPSIFGVENPLVPRSTMKPRILPSSFAHTTATSAIGELVIHIFAPVSLIAAGDLLGARRPSSRGRSRGRARSGRSSRPSRRSRAWADICAAAPRCRRRRSGASPARTAPTSPSGSRNRRARSRARSGRRPHSRGPRRRIPPGWSRRAARARPSRASLAGS